MLDVDATIALLTKQPAQTVFLCDFDGTLSPFVEHAADARPAPGGLAVLQRLAARLGRVGIISGRPIEFLVEHARVPGIVFAGVYGMQQWIDGEIITDPRVLPYLDEVEAAARDLDARAPHALVERKGGVSVTLHWRPAPDRADEFRALGREVAQRRGLAVLETRTNIELRPPVAIDKGDAVRALAKGFEVGAYAGDDMGDLPAYTGIVDAGLRVAVRIGVVWPDSPAQITDLVDVEVTGPEGLVALLDRVADEIV